MSTQFSVVVLFRRTYLDFQVGFPAAQSMARLSIITIVVGLLVLVGVVSCLVSYLPLLFRNIDAAGGVGASVAVSLHIGLTRLLESRVFHLASAALDVVVGSTAISENDLSGIAPHMLRSASVFSTSSDSTLPFVLYQVFPSGNAVYVGSWIPCDAANPGLLPSSVTAATVYYWVTMHFGGGNQTYVAEQFMFFSGNKTAVAVPGTRRGPTSVTYLATQQSWYQGNLSPSTMCSWDTAPRASSVSNSVSLVYGCSQVGIASDGLNRGVAAIEIMTSNSNFFTHVIGSSTSSSLVRAAMIIARDTNVLVSATFSYASLDDNNNPVQAADIAVPFFGSSELWSAAGLHRNCSTPCFSSYGSTFRTQQSVVVVTDMTSPPIAGLTLRLVTRLDTSDVLPDQKKAHEDTAVITVLSTFGITCSAAVLAVAFLRPLVRLVGAVSDQHSSNTDEEDFPSAASNRSVVDEVARLQEAIGNMRKELRTVKSYVPQAVLRMLEGPASDDDDSGTPMDEGSLRATESSRLSSGGSWSQSSVTDFDNSTNQSGVPVSPGAAAVKRWQKATHQNKRRTLSNPSSPAIAASVLTLKRVTVAVVNMNQTHQNIRDMGIGSFQTLHSKWMTVLEESVGRWRGVVESISGDHFTISFNASATCASHQANAAAFVLTLKEALTNATAGGGTLATLPLFTVGISSGQAHCGQLGTDRSKAFAVLGSAVTTAHALVRRARHRLRISNAVCSDAVEGMKYEFGLMPVDVVALPSSDAGGAPVVVIVHEIMHRLSRAADEWMYELQDTSQNPSATLERRLALHYAAFAALCEKTHSSKQKVEREGDVAEMKREVAAIMVEAPESRSAARLQQLLERLNEDVLLDVLE